MSLRHGIVASFVATTSLFLAVACGAGRSSEAPASAPEKSAPAADESTTQSAPAAAGAPAQAPAPAYAPAPAEEAPRSYGAAPAPAPRKPAGPASTRSESEIDDSSDFGALTSQFEKALALSTPDCTLSWALRDKICDLSQRLCDLAARSAEPDMDGRCRDGRARCEHATARVRAVCPE